MILETTCAIWGYAAIMTDRFSTNYYYTTTCSSLTFVFSSKTSTTRSFKYWIIGIAVRLHQVQLGFIQQLITIIIITTTRTYISIASISSIISTRTTAFSMDCLDVISTSDSLICLTASSSCCYSWIYLKYIKLK